MSAGPERDRLTPLRSVATGYGQRPWTLYDWTLDPGALKDPSYLLPEELSHRVQIERFCDKVTKALYSNPTDPVGLTKADERHILCNLLARDFDELEARIGPVAPDVPPPVGQGDQRSGDAIRFRSADSSSHRHPSSPSGRAPPAALCALRRFAEQVVVPGPVETLPGRQVLCRPTVVARGNRHAPAALRHQLHLADHRRERLHAAQASKQPLGGPPRSRGRQGRLQRDHSSDPPDECRRQRSTRSSRRGLGAAVARRRCRRGASLRRKALDRPRGEPDAQGPVSDEHESRVRLGLAVARGIPSANAMQPRLYVPS